MVAEEADRHALLEAVADAFGEEAAQTLGELLPQAGARPATKEDVDGVLAVIDAMDERIDARFERLESRMTAVEGRLDGLEARLDGVEAGFDLLEERLGGLFERRLNDVITTQTRTVVLSMVGAVTVMAGLVVGVG